MQQQRTSSYVRRAVVLAIVAALGWSDDAMPQELLATQAFFALHLLSLAAAITGAVIASRRAVSTDA